MCSCARSIAGLCRVRIGKCNAKQVRREVRTGWHDLTMCVHGRLSEHAGRVAYLAHPQDGFKEVVSKEEH